MRHDAPPRKFSKDELFDLTGSVRLSGRTTFAYRLRSPGRSNTKSCSFSASVSRLTNEELELASPSRSEHLRPPLHAPAASNAYLIKRARASAFASCVLQVVIRPSHKLRILGFVDAARLRRTLPSCLRMLRSSGFRFGLISETGEVPFFSVTLQTT